MKIEKGVIIFENLVRPSSETVGEKAPIKAKSRPFVASNAKGSARKVEDLHEVQSIGKQSADQLKALFA